MVSAGAQRVSSFQVFCHNSPDVVIVQVNCSLDTTYFNIVRTGKTNVEFTQFPMNMLKLWSLNISHICLHIEIFSLDVQSYVRMEHK